MKEHIFEIEPAMPLPFSKGEAKVEIQASRIEVKENLFLFGEISHKEAEIIFGDRLFHLDDQQWLSEWEPERTLEVHLKLNPEIKSKYPDEDKLVTGIAHLEAEFVDEASWFVLEIFQKLPLPWDETEFVTIGIKTSHADY